MKEENEEIEEWAQEQWGRAQLGDKRRTKRAVRVGALMAAQPSASLPKQTQSWKELKAAYRLINEEDVTHEKLSRGHWEDSRRMARQSKERAVLFIQDGSEIDYTSHQKAKGLGHTGNGKGRGLILHSCLAVTGGAKAHVYGMAAQTVWARQYRKKETATQRMKRRCETDVWAEVIEQIGPAPNQGPIWVSVGDRGSDIFSYIRRARQQGWQCLLRACQDRVIGTTEATGLRLKSWARSLKPQAKKTIHLRARDGLPKRDIALAAAWSEVLICAPKMSLERNQEPIALWCIRCWNDKESLEWILLTSLPVLNEQSALEQIDWYGQRWLIEEYHKCLKTGCSIEKSQLESAESLMTLFGFLCIVAVRLLQLRTVSRQSPQSPAIEFVPQIAVDLLIRRLKLRSVACQITMREFWHGVARLGGFIGRKSDGDPGWLTLWRGWLRLQDMCWALSPQ